MLTLPQRRTWISFGTYALVVLVTITAASLLVGGYLSRDSKSAFEGWISWATIIGTVAGLVGVVVAVLALRPRSQPDTSAHIEDLALRLAKVQLRDHKRRLSDLIGTNVPESHPLIVRFRRNLRTKGSHAGPHNSGDINTFVEFYRTHTNGRVVLTGEPGVGKTVYALHMSIELLKYCLTYKGSEENPERIPVILSAPSWDLNLSFEEWLIASITEQFGLTKNDSRSLVEEYRILPILDDLDGMDLHDNGPDRARKSVEHLNRYLAAEGDAKLVVICRAGRRYKQLIRNIRHAEHITLESPTIAEIQSYIEGHCQDPESRDDWAKVISTLHSPLRPRLHAAIGSAWRLTAAMTFYREGGDPNLLLPTDDEKSHAQQAYVDRVKDLLLEAFLRSRVRLYHHQKYTLAFVHRKLSLVSSYLDDLAQSGDSGTDITPHSWWKVHKKKVISRQTWLTFFTVTLFITAPLNLDAAREGFDDIWDFAEFLCSYWMFKLAIPRAAATIGGYPTIIRIGTLRNPGPARRLFISGLVFSSVLGYCGYSVLNPIYATLLTLGVLAMVTLVASQFPTEAIVMGPMEIIRRDFASAAICGLTIGVTMGLLFAYIYNPVLGIGFGLANGIGWLLSSSSMRYIIAAGMTMEMHRFGGFLNWAHTAGLMRISGNSYQFRHTELQEMVRSGDLNNHAYAFSNPTISVAR